MNEFTKFFSIWVPLQYRGLWANLKGTYVAIFGRQNSNSWNRFVLYQHGMIWRLLMDLGILAGTLLRVLFGALTIAVVFCSAPVLAILRAIAIPIIATGKGIWIARKISKAARANGQT